MEETYVNYPILQFNKLIHFEIIPCKLPAKFEWWIESVRHDKPVAQDLNNQNDQRIRSILDYKWNIEHPFEIHPENIESNGFIYQRDTIFFCSHKPFDGPKHHKALVVAHHCTNSSTLYEYVLLVGSLLDYQFRTGRVIYIQTQNKSNFT